jgi:hypothetical protein
MMIHQREKENEEMMLKTFEIKIDQVLKLVLNSVLTRLK